MEYTGLVKGFARYSDDQMEQMRRDLSITMSIPMLRYCASYFKSKEKRDPSIRELMLLDRYAALLGVSPHAVAPSEVVTVDQNLAQTYADMMNKRRTMNPKANAPATFHELSELINRYLVRVGKTRTRRDMAVLCEDAAMAHGASVGENCLAVSDSDFRLRCLSLSGSERAPTDRFVLFTPLSNEVISTNDRALFSELLEHAELMRVCKEICMVNPCGLLFSLLSISDGAWIELTALSATGAAAPWQGLTDAFCGCYVARIAQQDQKKVEELAESLGLRARVFGGALAQNQVVFAAENIRQYSFETEFLRTFMQISPVRAVIAEQPDSVPFTRQSRLSVFSCRYIKSEKEAQSKDTVLMADHLFASAIAISEQASFYKSFYAALMPVLTLALSGCPYGEQSLGLGYKLPPFGTDEQRNGETVAVLLGLYRLQAELAIPASSVELSIDEDATHPSVTAFAFGKGPGVSNTFTEGGTVLSCIRPDFGSGKLPDMNGLRAMLSELADLRCKGVLCSARVLVDGAITDAIIEMSGENFSVTLTDPNILVEGKVPIALLLETTMPIGGAYEIGRIERRESLNTDSGATIPEETASFVAQPRLIWSETCELVIVCHKHDRHASFLAELLAKKGAYVSLHDNEPESCGQLSRAILTADCVLLCDLSRLPEEPHVSFAVDTMLRAGGQILTVGDFFGSRYPNGIPMDVIDAICEK